MTENTQIALITFVVGPGVLAVMHWLLNRNQRRALGRIEEQVSNDHVDDPGKTSNLREDMDEKHHALVRLVTAAVRDIGGIRSELRQLRRDLSRTDERVDDLERTRPKGRP